MHVLGVLVSYDPLLKYVEVGKKHIGPFPVLGRLGLIALVLG